MKKLSNDKIDEIAGYVGKGLPLDSVAALSDVSVKTLKRWLGRAKRGDEKDPLIYKLGWAVEKAHAKFVQSNLDNISKAGKAGSYQASQWLLEKRDARNFGKNQGDEESVTKVLVVPAVAGSVEEWMEKHGPKKEEEAGQP